MRIDLDVLNKKLTVIDEHSLIDDPSKYGLRRVARDEYVIEFDDVTEVVFVMQDIQRISDQAVNAKPAVRIDVAGDNASADIGGARIRASKHFSKVIEILRRCGWRHDPYRRDRIVYNGRRDQIRELTDALSEAGFQYIVHGDDEILDESLVSWRMTEPSEAFVRWFDENVRPKMAADVNPRGYQLAAVEFSKAMGHRCLIADQMGLGKTIEAILTSIASGTKLTIIVCPGNVKYNWEREVKRWWPNVLTIVVEGRKPIGYAAAAKVSITTVAILSWDVLSHQAKAIIEAIEELDKDVMVIADEAHKAKNTQAKRTKALREITRLAKYFVALTGTPVLNRPEEVWTVMNMISPANFPHGSRMQYSTYRVHDQLKRFMIRRSLDDVDVQLPEMTRQFIEIPLDGRAADAYNEAIHKLLEEKKEGASYASMLAQLTLARMAIGQVKAEAACEVIQELVDAGERVVVFTMFKDALKKIVRRFNALKIDGSVNAEKKQRAADKFNAGENPVIVIQTTAGNAGMNLQTARYCVFVELPWSPKDVEQAEARIHRLGQSHSTVSIILLVRGTIDDYMRQLLERKRVVADRTVDGEIVSESFTDGADGDANIVDAITNWLEVQRWSK